MQAKEEKHEPIRGSNLPVRQGERTEKPKLARIYFREKKDGPVLKVDAFYEKPWVLIDVERQCWLNYGGTWRYAIGREDGGLIADKVTKRRSQVTPPSSASRSEKVAALAEHADTPQHEAEAARAAMHRISNRK